MNLILVSHLEIGKISSNTVITPVIIAAAIGTISFTLVINFFCVKKDSEAGRFAIFDRQLIGFNRSFIGFILTGIIGSNLLGRSFNKR